MENLQIITKSITPAKVDFNYKTIETELDKTLAKYAGLVFTEETAADCKRTMADLRKGQKSLDQFRLKTKKKLTAPVTEFEKDCKILYKKFDEVIDPLKEQADYFEENRREGKRVEVQGVIDDTIELYKLDDKHSQELILEDGYLIASISIKKVTENIEKQAAALRENQDQEELDKAFIIDTVNSMNADDGINLLSSNYILLMGTMGLSRVIDKIHQDQKEVLVAKKREEDRIKQEELLKEEARIQSEQLQAEKLIEEERLANIVEQEEIIKADTPAEEYINIVDFEKLAKEREAITRIFKIKASIEQMKEIENFIEQNSEKWGIYNE